MASNPLLLWVVPLVSLALGPCSGPEPPADSAPPDAPVGAVRLELGSGQLQWEDLAPAARVELIHGPQGGYHIFGRVRFDRLGPAVAVTFRVTPAAGGAPLNDPADRIRLAEGRGLIPANGSWECANALLVVLTTVNSQSAAAALVNQRFRFEATVTSNDTGQSATTSREIVIVDDT